MLSTSNTGLLLALSLIMVSTQFRSRNVQIALGILAVVAIMGTLNLFTDKAWSLYSPGLLLLFGLFGIYTDGKAQPIFILGTVFIFSDLVIL
jgi:hypothetical protein